MAPANSRYPATFDWLAENYWYWITATGESKCLILEEPMFVRFLSGPGRVCALRPQAFWRTTPPGQGLRPYPHQMSGFFPSFACRVCLPRAKRGRSACSHIFILEPSLLALIVNGKSKCRSLMVMRRCCLPAMTDDQFSGFTVR